MQLRSYGGAQKILFREDGDQAPTPQYPIHPTTHFVIIHTLPLLSLKTTFCDVKIIAFCTPLPLHNLTFFLQNLFLQNLHLVASLATPEGLR